MRSLRTSVISIGPLRVPGRSVGAIVDSDLVRIRVVGDGPLPTRQFVPETPRAAQLLEGPSGKRLSQALRGVLEMAGEGPAAARIDGFAWSRRRDGFVANHVLTLAGQVAGPVRRPGSRAAAGVDTAVAAWQRHVDGQHRHLAGALGTYSGWVTLGPRHGRALERLTDAARSSRLPGVFVDRSSRQVAALALHEALHGAPQDPATVRWVLGTARRHADQPVEEGIVSLLSHQRGRVGRTIDAMDLPHAGDASRARAGRSYADDRRLVRGVLALAGHSGADAAATSRRLRTTSVSATVDQLAADIARRSPTGVSAVEVAAGIRSLDGRPSRLGKLARDLQIEDEDVEATVRGARLVAAAPFGGAVVGGGVAMHKHRRLRSEPSRDESGVGHVAQRVGSSMRTGGAVGAATALGTIVALSPGRRPGRVHVAAAMGAAAAGTALGALGDG